MTDQAGLAIITIRTVCSLAIRQEVKDLIYWPESVPIRGQQAGDSA